MHVLRYHARRRSPALIRRRREDEVRRNHPLCKKGLHRLDAANTYDHPSKGPECRECKRDYMRDYMRELRARMRKPSRKRAAVKARRAR